jgi:hypothetical protein
MTFPFWPKKQAVSPTSNTSETSTPHETCANMTYRSGGKEICGERAIWRCGACATALCVACAGHDITSCCNSTGLTKLNENQNTALG